MITTNVFSDSYVKARERFRQAAKRLGWELETHQMAGEGPNGEELTIDVARSTAAENRATLIVSSATHGVEGFFGSAVQLGLLEQWSAGTKPVPSVNLVFIHALNPHGFAWVRRFTEQNVDLNRNFLLPGESFTGSPARYASLDSFLNPRRPPSRLEPFRLKTALYIMRFGMRSLQQALTRGQYDFPKGLFYGGSGPTKNQQLLATHLARWIGKVDRVVHIDLHTGLGAPASCELLIDYDLTDGQRQRLTRWFGSQKFKKLGAGAVAAEACGGLGRWCVAQNPGVDYLFLIAEFGTRDRIEVFRSLRAENQAHHWGKPDDPATLRAKADLREAFCPSEEQWRREVLAESYRIVDVVVAGVNDTDPARAS